MITNLASLRDQVPPAVEVCVGFFPSVDRTASGYEGLIAAQQCLPDNTSRDAFAKAYSQLNQLWEALSPDPCLKRHGADYQWMSQVYESLRPPSGNGKLLWHALGAKTLELTHENVHVEAVRDDLETFVLDADVLEELVSDGNNAKELEIKIIARLQKHAGNPKFIGLGRRLEDLRERHAIGVLNSLDFLKQLLALAREVVQAEQETDPAEEQNRAKAALTELFSEVKSAATPILVERIVNDIDDIVRVVRYPDWRQTLSGEREVQKALRRTLLKYQLHREQELFDRAYAYIKQYY